MADVKRSKHATLAPNVVTEVTFEEAGFDFEIVSEINDRVFVRWDGVDPTVDGDETSLLRARDSLTRHVSKPTDSVKLISASGGAVHVERLQG